MGLVLKVVESGRQIPKINRKLKPPTLFQNCVLYFWCMSVLVQRVSFILMFPCYIYLLNVPAIQCIFIH